MSYLKKLFSKASQINTIHFYALGILLISLTILIGTIIYAHYYAGNMVMSVDPEAISSSSIELSENVEFESQTHQLIVDSNISSSTTFEAIHMEDITLVEGKYIDPDNKLMAYNFYIRNSGPNMIIINYYMRLVEVSNGLDQYVRIFIIDEHGEAIYKKMDQENNQDEQQSNKVFPQTIHFLSDNTVMRDSSSVFEPGQIKFFRVVIWLEENDVDMSEDIQSGFLKAMLAFNINKELSYGDSVSISLSNRDEKMWIPMYTICTVSFNFNYEAEDIS